MIREQHIEAILSLLEKEGRDPQVCVFTFNPAQ